MGAQRCHVYRHSGSEVGEAMMLQTYRDNLTGEVHTVEAPDVQEEPVEVPEPQPTLDERGTKVESDVATTQEVLDALLGGA